MTDLEMTRLCAIAMKLATVAPPKGYEDLIIIAGLSMPYVPLHDDAQAMALVKKFELTIHRDSDVNLWFARYFIADENNKYLSIGHQDLNRAIVECVAKMQAAKEPA